MKSTQALSFALRVSYSQIGSQAPVRTIAKKDYSAQSAALLAAIGLSMSGFSLKQMASKSPKKF